MSTENRLVRFVAEQPWALKPEALDTLVEVVALRAAGVRLTGPEVEARLDGARRTAERVITPGGIMVLRLMGLISQRVGLLTDISGGTSTEAFGAELTMAMRDPDVRAVIIEVDSPGGSVRGVQELANVMHGFRGVKPMVAVANSDCASAAFHLAAQADELVVTPSGEVGSVGVICVHVDQSGALEKAGLRYNVVTSSSAPRKAEFSPHAPLSTDALAFLQEQIDEHEETFVRHLARGRGTTPAFVRAHYGQGRMLMARAAAAVGMVDRVATLQQVVEDVASAVSRPGRSYSAVRNASLNADEENAFALLQLAAADLGGLCVPRESKQARDAKAERDLQLAKLRLADAG